jgi:hypothetical protein
MRAHVACALAAVGSAALLAGGALAPPAGASAGRAPRPAAVSRARLVLHSTRRPRLLSLGRRPALPVANRKIHAADDFTTHVSPDNTFFLQLDMAGASTANWGGLIDWWSNQGSNQNWTFSYVGQGLDYEIINQNSGLCLMSDGIAGDQVYQLPCNPADTRQWWTTGMTPGDILAWSIQNVASGLYMDVYGDSPWAGASIDTWYWNGGYNQYFFAD